MRNGAAAVSEPPDVTPNSAEAPFKLMVSAVMVCVLVTKTSVPSGVLVFSGNVIVPLASVPAGCNSTHCDETGVGSAILNPVVGVYSVVATVGEAKFCWKYVSSELIDSRLASPLCGAYAAS